ncbi:Mg2+ transporter protein CorA-like/Zinc transport protein ZntB [Penicillium herquei]|nr:Mg2+ transporter protein CorA-like/Zinc transport protein ZntB [Penicillium herquei]
MADPMSDAKDTPPDQERSPSVSLSYGMEDIKQAILQNKGALVEGILVKNPDILEIRFDFSFDSDDYVTTGITPLIFAAFLGRYTITKLLLSKGANMLTRTKSGGINAFLATAMENFLDVGKLILEAGGPTQLDLRSTGKCNALYLVSWKDGVEYAQYLLDQGVDLRTVDEDEQTALHAASLSGNLPLARIFLEKDINLLNMEDFWFQTPIMLAAINEHFDVVQFFLEKGADISKRDDDSRDVLHIALTKGNLDTVRTIVERQVGSDQTSHLETPGPDGKTAIMTAALHGHFEVFQYLVSKGADMTKLDTMERTLLHLAAEGGDLGIVKFIFDKQPALMEIENIDGDTALLNAADCGHLEIVQYLLNKGAEIRKTGHQDWNALRLAAKTGRIEVVKFLVDNTALGKEYISEEAGHDGSTPLMLAVENGKLDVTSYFIEKGADTIKTNLLGNTLLHLAAQNSNADMLEVLFDNIPRDEKQIRLERPNNAGETPLEVATRDRNMDAITFFLAQGAQVNTQGKIGEKMFQDAASSGHLELVQKLVEKRPDLLDHINDADETGLSFASTGNVEVVEYLCTKGANVNFQQLLGETALFQAIKTHSMPIVDYLMTQPIDFRLTNNRGENILHYACEFGFPEIVAKVLDHSWSLDRHEDWKATVIARNIEGKTPLHCAITRANVDISTIFLFLESDAYFPSNPAQDKGLVCSPDERELISIWLERWINIMARSESQRKLEAVIYWALLNNETNIMTLITDLGDISLLDRRGVTWLHVTALVGKTGMEGNVLLESIPYWQDNLLEEMSPRNKATPLSIAVKEGNSDMVELFLDRIDSFDLRNLLVRVSKQEESLIWLAAINRKETTELLLWNSLFKIIKNEMSLLNFRNSHGKDQEFLMGLAAWRYTTGIEYPFNFLMDHMEEISPPRTGQAMAPPTPLQLIVRHKFPVALWWLLSSGSYFGESHIKEGRTEMEQWALTSNPGETNARKLIKSLLDHSPPERPLSNFETELLDFRFRDSISELQEGTVVDLSISDQNNITIQFAQTSMKDIVYTKGPDQIMRENKNYSLQDIENELFGARVNRKERQKKARLQPKENTGTGKQDAKERRREEREVDIGSEQKSRPQRRVRWIHIPVNNVSLTSCTAPNR